MTSTPPGRDGDRSPLLAEPSSRRSGEIWSDAEALKKQAEKELETKSSWYLFLLALGIGG